MVLTYEDKMSTTGSQYASATNKLSPPRSAPSFVAPLEAAEEEVRSLRARICSLSDRLCGSVPEGDASGLHEVPSGVFDAVSEMGRSISRNVSEAREALDRIERALP